MIVDVHCGGGRWLIAMAKRFPGTALVGVEFEPDSVARARAHVEEAGLADRIAIEHGDLGHVGHAGRGRPSPTSSTRSTSCADPVGAIASAWAAVRPGGWLVALDWYLPTDPDELRTRACASSSRACSSTSCIQGTRLVSRSEAARLVRGRRACRARR